MSSRKRSARAKRIAAFKSQLNGASDMFEREDQRRERRSRQHEAAVRRKACESKKRYACRRDAEEAIAACERYGTTGLHCYRCPWCEGWHLTSKPQVDHAPESTA